MTEETPRLWPPSWQTNSAVQRSRDAAKQKSRHEKTARAAEERARRHEQVRKDSLGAV
jgi:hypothetical protein